MGRREINAIKTEKQKNKRDRLRAMPNAVECIYCYTHWKNGKIHGKYERNAKRNACAYMFMFALWCLLDGFGKKI